MTAWTGLIAGRVVRACVIVGLLVGLVGVGAGLKGCGSGQAGARVRPARRGRGR